MSHPLYPANQMPPPGEAPSAGEGPSAGELLPGGEPLSAGPAPDGRGDVESRVPQTSWPPWMAPVALVAAIVFAAIGGLGIDIPAVALGAKIRGSHVPPGLEIADTAVQDIAFVFVACFVASLGGRRVYAWQFGLRPTSFWRAVRLAVGAAIAFLVFLLIWSAFV